MTVTIVGLTVLLAWSIRLLDGLADAAHALSVDIAAAFTAAEAADDATALDFHHQRSVCCEDAVRGGQLALAFVLLSGMPLSLAALVAVLVTPRRGALRWPRAAGTMFQASFVLQWSSLMLSAGLTLPALWFDARSTLAEWQGAYLLTTTMASALALPMWRRAALAATEAPSLSLLDLGTTRAA